MKKDTVKLGVAYAAKVSGKVVPVRLDKLNPHGGWDGVNTVTNRKVRIKSPQRLRAVAGQRPAKRKKMMSLAEYEAEAKGDQQPVGTFSFKIPLLGPYESKELKAPVDTKLRVYELPDWQFLRADFQITSP